MFEAGSVKVSLRLERNIHDAIESLAHASGFETNSYIQRILQRHATQSDIMGDAARRRAKLFENIIDTAVQRAQDLYAAGQFDQDFVLTVIRNLVKDSIFRAKYEEFVGGDAYESGLPGKSPINMYLGWYIKNAVGAEPQLDEKGKPRRAQIRNEPVQSYTLLQKQRNRGA